MKTVSENKDVIAILSLAQHLVEFGYFEKANSLIALAKWLEPENSDLDRIKAECLVKMGHHSEAYALFVQYLDKRSSRINTPDRQLFARILWALGRIEQGNKVFLDVLKKKSKSAALPA